MQEKIKQSGAGSWKADFKKFVALYESDLPNPRLVYAEMDIWEMKWRKHIGVLHDRISTSLKVCKPMELSFPNLYCCLKILGTIPVTTCECERSVPSLRRLKSTMGEERLNRLATMHVHKDINMDLEMIIDDFAVKHKRRLKFRNILDSDGDAEFEK